MFTGEETDEAADFLIRFGLLTTLPTAAVGLTDWADTQERDRRVGVAHAATNATAAFLYAVSLLARRKGRRGMGTALGVAGGVVATMGSYVGGHLSLGKGIGVDHTAFEEEPRQWAAALADAELAEGQVKVTAMGGGRVALLRRGGRVYCLAERCNHLGGPLHEGEIRDETVTCPWHGSTFRLEDGAVVRGPARAPQPAYETRVRDGKIEVRLANR